MVGEPVKHVRQRFGVHQAVFNHNMKDLTVFHERFVGMGETCLLQVFIDRLSDVLIVGTDFVHGRPILGPVLRELSVDWINSKGEDAVKFGIERPGSK